MTPHDHNKTLGIIYGLLGGLLAVLAAVELVRIVTLDKELNHVRSDSALLTMIIAGLILMVVLIATSYGLFKRRNWARISTLILAGLLVLLFPLGTALAIYTWWFMHSEGAKKLYLISSP